MCRPAFCRRSMVILLSVFVSVPCAFADNTHVQVVQGGIQVLLSDAITSKKPGNHSLIQAGEKLNVDDAQELIENILANATAASKPKQTFQFDSSTTYVIDILKFQDDTHTTASDQNWYAFNANDIKHYGWPITLESGQKIIEGARLYGETKVVLIGIFMNEDGASPGTSTLPNVNYKITETKKQRQLATDFQSLLSIVFGAAGANQVGYFFCSNVTLTYRTSDLTIEGFAAPLLKTTSKSYPDATSTAVVTLDQNKNPNPLSLRIGPKRVTIQLASDKNNLDGLRDAIRTTINSDPTLTNVKVDVQPDVKGSPSTLTMTVQGWSGAASLSLSEVDAVQNHDPILQTSNKQTSLGKQAFHNEDGSWITLGISVPLNSYKDISFQQSTTTSGPMLQPTSITRQNIYASVGFYYPRVDPLNTRFSWIPHPIIGIPITTSPLRRSMAGLGVGLNWVEPFAAVVFNDTQVRPTNTTDPTRLNNHLVIKGIFGINLPLSTAAKLLKNKSSSPSTTNTSTSTGTNTTNTTNTTN
jgi:hypothetical protein